MARETAGVEVIVDNGQAIKSIKDLRTEISKTEEEVKQLTKAYGENSDEVAQKSKQLAKLQGDLNGKIQKQNDAIDNAGKTVASLSAAYGGLQGALELTGFAGDDTMKQLAKIQSALAIGDAIQNLTEFRDAIKKTFTGFIKYLTQSAAFQKINSAATVVATAVQRAFGVSVVGTGTAFKVLKAAIISTGIGALVVGVGLLVSKIMDWTSSTEDNKAAQDRLNTALEQQERLFAQQQKSLNQQRQVAVLRAKIAGQSADEIFQINQQYNAKDLQAATENRNKIFASLKQFEKDRLTLKENGRVEGSEEDIAAYKEAAKQLETANTQLADIQFKNQTEVLGEQQRLNDDRRAKNKTASDKRKQDNQKEADERLQAEQDLSKQLLDLQNEYNLSSIKDEDERARKQLEIEKKAAEKSINDSKASQETKDKLLAQLKINFQQKQDQLDADIRKKEEDRVRNFQDKLNQIQTEVRLAGIKDQRVKEREQLAVELQSQIQDILRDETLKEDERQKIIAQIKEKNKIANDELTRKNAEEDFNKELEKISKLISDNELEFSVRKEAIDKQRALVDENFKNGIINQEQYNQRVKELNDAAQKVDDEKTQAQIQNAQKVAGILSGLSDLFGKETAAGKVTAIAAATINTYLAASQALTGIQKLNPLGATIAIAQAGLIIANGIKQIREISKVKVPKAAGGGGGSVPSLQGVQNQAAPITPQAPIQNTVTQLNQQSINQLGSATNRAYVLETDVTNNQERIRRINRAARLN